MTQQTLTHLDDRVRLLVETGTNKDRIIECKMPKMIGYKAAHNILEDLEMLLEQPKKDRMPCRLLIARSNNGKTTIINFLYAKHKAYIENGVLINPIVKIEAPEEADVKALYGEILNELNIKIRTRETPQSLRFRVIHHLKKLGVRMLIIDEIHHLISGQVTKHRIALNGIKILSNKLQIPIVAVGVEEAQNTIESDRQLENRFIPMILPDWKDDTEDYYKLLYQFSRILPLKLPSELDKKRVASKLIIYSGGLIGEISNILQNCAVEAIKSGEERITEKLIDQYKNSSPIKRREIEF